MLDEEELPAFVRGKLCDIMPLFSFSVGVCVLSVYFPSQKKKKKDEEDVKLSLSRSKNL